MPRRKQTPVTHVLSRFFSGSAFLFAVRLGGAGIGFLTQVLLARMLGSHELGIFYSATSLAAVAGFVTSRGYSQIAYRFSARYRAEGRSRLFQAFVSRAAHDALTASTGAAAIVVLCSFLAPGMEQSDRIVWALAGALIVPSAMLVLYTNLAGAIRMFGWCYVPEGIFKPLAFMILVGALWFVEDAPTGSEVMLLFSVVIVAVAIAVVRALQPHLPELQNPGRPERRLAQRWRAEAQPLVLLSLYTNTFADVAILFATPFLSQSDLAVFGVCLKLSLLIGYFVQIAQQMAIPDLADARQRGDAEGMRRAAKRSVLLPLAMTLGAVAGCVVLGREALAVFGPEFAPASGVLLIMVLSQLGRAAAGPSAHLLTLTGAQRVNATLCVGALVVLAAATALLAPVYGPAGAAWAVSASYVGWLIATAIVLERMGEMRTDLMSLLTARRTPRQIPAE